MKIHSFFPIGLLSLLGSYCFFNTRKAPSAAANEGPPPTTISLIDSALSVTLQATMSGGNWVVNNSAASSYLSQVASASFSKTVSNFQNILVTVPSDYAFVGLEGTATDGNGNKIPIGIKYEPGSGSTPANLNMKSKEKHTCTGAPCSCCGFEYSSINTIIGCRCKDGMTGCEGTGQRQCNHTVESAD